VRRAPPTLPPQKQLQRLEEWLRARLVAAPVAPDRKKQLRRRLLSIESTTQKLVKLLADDIGLQVMDELYLSGSDMRAHVLLELAERASSTRAELDDSRERTPQAQAALMFLHLLYRNGSRWPSMSGDEGVHSSPEVACFNSLLAAAGHVVEAGGARLLLTRQRESFAELHRFNPPAPVERWLDEGPETFADL